MDAFTFVLLLTGFGLCALGLLLRSLVSRISNVKVGYWSTS